MKLQVSSSKLQKGSKSQVPISEIPTPAWSLELEIYLELGTWNLEL
jgi:hypothetical protein